MKPSLPFRESQRSISFRNPSWIFSPIDIQIKRKGCRTVGLMVKENSRAFVMRGQWEELVSRLLLCFTLSTLSVSFTSFSASCVDPVKGLQFYLFVLPSPLRAFHNHYFHIFPIWEKIKIINENKYELSMLTRFSMNFVN